MKKFFLVILLTMLFFDLRTVTSIQQIDSSYEFLSSEEPLLDLSAAMLTKRKNCCVPSGNSCALEVFVGGANVTSFLPTGPTVPITANYFYAYRQISLTVPVLSIPVNIPFSGVGANDGNWVWDGFTNFTAQTSGVYLISVVIPYQYDLDETAVSLFLQPTLDGAVINFTTVAFFDQSANFPLLFTNQLKTTFIVSVNANQILRFQDFITDGSGDLRRIGVPSNVTTNGSLTIVRIK